MNEEIQLSKDPYANPEAFVSEKNENEDNIGITFGTTLNASVAIDDYLWTANLGDSRTIIFGDKVPEGKTECLSTSTDKHGGIHDIYYDPKGFSDKDMLKDQNGREIRDENRRPITVTNLGFKGAEVTRYSLDEIKENYGENIFMLQACDGLFDILPAAKIREIIMSKLGGTDALKAAVIEAQNEGSMDNITVNLIKLS